MQTITVKFFIVIPYILLTLSGIIWIDVFAKNAKDMLGADVSLPLKNKSLITVVILLFVLVIIFAGFLTRKSTNSTASSKNKLTLACSQTKKGQQITAQAADSLKQGSASKLESQVASIKNLPNYQKDPTCMYIITNYYISISDPVNARKNYNLLISAEAQGPHNVVSLPGPLASNDELGNTIKFLEKQAATIKPIYY